MSSMLLYIITNAVLFSFLMTHEQIPQEMAAWIIDKNSASGPSCWWSTSSCWPPATSWIRRRSC
jgi:hypothetical protein